MTSSHDCLIRIWDSRYLSHCKYTIIENAPITNVQYSNNGLYILVSTLESNHKLYDLNYLNDFNDSNEIKSSNEINNNNNIYHHMNEPELLSTYNGHICREYNIQSSFYSNDNNEQYILSGSEDQKVSHFSLLLL